MRRDGTGSFAAFLAAFFLLLGVVVAYVDGAVLDSGNFTNHALDALDDAGVRAELSQQIANSLVPAGAQDASAGAAIDSASGRLFDAPSFRTIVRVGVANLHSAVLDHGANSVGVQLNGVGDPVRNALQQSDPALAAQVSPAASATVLSGDPPAWILSAARTAKSVHVVGIVLLAAAALMAVIALATSSWRVATLGVFGGSLAVLGAILIAGLLLAKASLTGLANDPGISDALSGIWSAFFGGLLTELIVLAIAGAAIPIATRLLRLR